MIATEDEDACDGRVSVTIRRDGFLTPLDSYASDAMIMHMVTSSRTTVNLREDLLRQAKAATGIKRKTDLLHAGLEALIARDALERLAAMGGAIPDAKAAPRRRFPKARR